MNDNILEHAQLPGSLELAYVGDAIYEVAVRRRIVKTGAKVSALHRQAVSRVCAHAQAEAFGRVESMLTPEEAAVARRARHAHQSPPRNADRAEYHRATALEAVVDLASPQWHELAGRAKDMGSAAVFCLLATLGGGWAMILYKLFIIK